MTPDREFRREEPWYATHRMTSAVGSFDDGFDFGGRFFRLLALLAALKGGFEALKILIRFFKRLFGL
jgi:hypothetical protein